MDKRITLKNLKHAQFASLETHCFNATIYLDGERAFKASNEGSGGPNEYFPYHGQHEHDFNDHYRFVSDAAVDWVKENDLDFYERVKDDDDDWASLDFVITHVINEHLLLKHMRDVMKRKVVFFDRDDSKVYTISERPTPDKVNYLRSQHPTWMLFNDIASEDEQLALWRRA